MGSEGREKPQRLHLLPPTVLGWGGPAGPGRLTTGPTQEPQCWAPGADCSPVSQFPVVPSHQPCASPEFVHASVHLTLLADSSQRDPFSREPYLMASSSLPVGLLLCFVPTPGVAFVPGLSSDFRKAPTCLHPTGRLRAELVTGVGVLSVDKPLRLSWVSDVCHWPGAEREAAGFATSAVVSWAPRALGRATLSRPAHTRRSVPGVG